jgi:hypothetical protein
MAMKNGRQPKRDIKVPPKSMPNAGPHARPDAIKELANPR